MQNDEDKLSIENAFPQFVRLSRKTLRCPMPMYYSFEELAKYQEAQERIHDSLYPGDWAISEILPIAKMVIADIDTREIEESELYNQISQVVTTFDKRDRCPHISKYTSPLLDPGCLRDRHFRAKVEDLWREGVSTLLALETIDPDLETFSRRVNSIGGKAFTLRDAGTHKPLPLLPCAFHCMIFSVAERSLRALISKRHPEASFDDLMLKGRLILSCLQGAAARLVDLQKAHEWLVTSPWAQLGYLYQSKHSSTRQWNSALSHTFERLEANLDSDQQRFQCSNFRQDQHEPAYFKKAVKQLLEAIGPKSEEQVLFDQQIIELAHCFIWWVYEHRDAKDIANLPSKAELNKCLPASPDKINLPYRKGICSFPRDRSRLFKELGLSELSTGAGRKKGSKTTSGNGKIEELRADLPK